MMEKPKSNKSKSKYRHNRTQDHGDAALRKGHVDHGYWENRWDHRGVENADKTYLKEVIRDGLDDYYAQMAPHELEQEADRILREAGVSPLDTQDKKDEDESPVVKDEIYPTIAEVGGRTTKEIRDSLARAATLDPYFDDDFGDNTSGSHIRITNKPR